MEDVRFKKYLEKKYYNELFYSLEQYINSNRNNISNTCRLNDISIKRVYSLENRDNYLFIGDLYVDAVVKTFEDDYEDGHLEHYFIKVRGDLSKLDKTFEVVDVDINKHEIKNSLKDDFLPFYDNDSDYDRTANDFLNEYYPEIFEGKVINTKVLLERLGLKLESARLSDDLSIFGMIIFEDSSVDIYDNLLRPIKKEFHKNTIIVDLAATPWFSENEGMNLFTIIHECVHFYIHKKYFFFQKLMNNKQVVSSCKITGEYDNIYEIKWLERQANKIASRIIMPEEVIKEHINEYKKTHKLETASNYEELLKYLKNLFNVSMVALKVKLNELGYTKAIGVFEYVNGHYITSYITKEETKVGESYSIDILNFIRLSITDKKLINELQSKDYLYIDGHICLNNDKYLVRKDGITKLSEYALNNIDECCLKFEYTFNSNIKRPNNEELILYRVSNCLTPTVKYKSPYTGQVESKIDTKVWKRDLNELKEYKDSLTGSFSDTLKKVIKDYADTQEKAALYSGISISTIERLVSSGNSGTIRKTLLRICVGLKLHPIISEELFKKSNLDLIANTQENFFIKQIINYMYEEDVEIVMKLYDEVIKDEEDE